MNSALVWCFETEVILVESWNIKLNFSAFPVGGCWGQLMLLFWKLVDETQMSTTPEATSHHSSRKFLILLPLSHLESFISLWDTLYCKKHPNIIYEPNWNIDTCSSAPTISREITLTYLNNSGIVFRSKCSYRFFYLTVIC